MQQTELDFTRTHARRTDPVTSKKAAASMLHGAEAQRRAVHMALLMAGRPVTAEEIGVRCGLDMVQVCRRLPELERDGVAEPTGETRPTRSGRAARCWRLREV